MEITEMTQHPNRYAVDPVPFVFALMCAPLLVALAGFWIYLIPAAALVFGGPLYLLIGTPALLVYLYYHAGSVPGAAILGFAIMLLCLVGFAVWGDLTGGIGANDPILILGLFGLLFAPLWAAVFGALYNCWRSELSRQPLPPLA